MTEEPFGGSAHQAALSALKDAFADVRETRRPSIVWIDGGPGIGKSRVLRAFYG